MSRLTAVNPEHATGKTRELFNGIQQKLGFVPNMMRTMGNSPTLLESYLNLNDSLGKSKLGAKLHEQIAMVVAEDNKCEYCLSAHTAIGKMVGLDAVIIEATRSSLAIDPRTDAILAFAKLVVQKRGRISDTDLNAVKDAGITEGEIVEIIGHVALNVLTNYINNTAKTEIDFPKVNLVEEPSLSH